MEMFLALYVDDGLILAEDVTALTSFTNELKKAFEVTVSDLGYFVGMEIKHDIENGSIFVHQRNYIKQIISRFNMEDAKTSSTPADPHTHLNLSMNAESKEENIPYRQAVGCLMFTAIVSRPDIMYAVGVVSRYLTKHSTAHWNAVKRIIRYLKATSDLGIEYRKSANPTISGFSDSDYANDLDTRRSTTGYLFQQSGGPVTWNSQRQATVSLSTTEAEYVAASHASKEATWLRHLLQDIGQSAKKPTMIFMDNQSAIRLVHNPKFHKRTKHIDVKYHYIREKYYNGEIDIKYVSTKNQLADILTKPLPKDQFEILRTDIGMISHT